MSGHVVIALEALPYPIDTRVRAQAAALVEAGYEVTVACPTGHGHHVVDEHVGDVHVRRFRAPRAGRGAAGYLHEFTVSLARLGPLLRRIHRERPIDVLLICNPPDLMIALRWLLGRPTPAVVFDYREISPELFDAKFDSAPRWLARLLRAALLASEGWAVRAADAVITVSEPCRQIITGRGGAAAERVFLVGNGPDAERIYPVAPRPELRRGHEHLVLWLGAMSRQEGLERLIEAVRILVHERGRTDVGFAIVGPGDVHGDLREQIRERGLDDVVHLSGAVDDDLVRSYMATADLCLGVDERNGMNDRAAMRKILEYMAAGRPVVQFPLAEMQRLCGDATAYAANADPADLARVIETLLDDPADRDRLGKAGRRLVNGGLMWHQQVPALLSAIDAARHRPPAPGAAAVLVGPPDTALPPA